MRKSWNNVPDLEFGRCVQDHSDVRCSSVYEVREKQFPLESSTQLLTNSPKTIVLLQSRLTGAFCLHFKVLFLFL